MKVDQVSYLFDVERIEIEKVIASDASPKVRIRISDGSSDTVTITCWNKGQTEMPEVIITRKDERTAPAVDETEEEVDV